MSVKDVVDVLARALADDPGDVRVVESQQKDMTLVEVHLAPGDMGKVVGRQGRTVAALRTLASSAGEREGRQVKLEIRDGKP